jgi:Xaa-Pro aminopeptidase
MRKLVTSQKIYTSRLNALQQTLHHAGCDALLIDEKTNIYYLTGLDLSVGKLLVHTQGAHLFVDNRYFELAQKESPFPVILDPPAFETHLGTPEFSFIHSLGFDTENTSYKSYENLAKLVGEAATRPKLIPLDAPLKLQRAIKDPTEIALLHSAAHLGSQGFDYLCTFLKEGMTEQEAATALEIFWKQRGSKAVAFDPIIAFGANSSMPHYRAGSACLRRGHAVLIDIGVNLNHYHSDMTRMLFFGDPDPRLEKIHTIVKQAQQEALKLCRPGTTLGTLDTAARRLIEEKGYGQNFTHSLGHGVGLDIHEYPTIRNAPPFKDVVLAPGMVITIEPGIYLPGLGGVRIEDTVVITENGHINLTQRSPEPVRL